MRDHAYDRARLQTARHSAPARKDSLSRHHPSIGPIDHLGRHPFPPIPPPRLRVSAVGPIGLVPSDLPASPRKPRKFVRQNLRKPLQNPSSSTLVNPIFFCGGRPACPSPTPCRPRWPASMGKTSTPARLLASTPCVISIAAQTSVRRVARAGPEALN
jgi:hypothetical protein